MSLLQKEKIKRIKQLQSENLKKKRIESNAKIIEETAQKLQTFAVQYSSYIKNDSDFRNQFYNFCQSVGVDPLISQKNVWSELGFNDFYNQLSIKVLDYCIRQRKYTAGLIRFNKLLQHLKLKFKYQLSEKDVLRSLQSLSALTPVTVIKNQYLCLVPLDHSNQIQILIELFQKNGKLKISMSKQVGLEEVQLAQLISTFQTQGMIWQDTKAPGETEYYLSSSMMRQKFTSGEDALNRAMRQGRKVDIVSKGETNSKSSLQGKYVAKILNEDDYKPPEVSHDLKIAIMQGRQKKGLTQEKLAQMLNVQKAVIAGYQQGKGIPNIGLICQMQKIFDCKLPRPVKSKKSKDEQA